MISSQKISQLIGKSFSFSWDIPFAKLDVVSDLAIFQERSQSMFSQKVVSWGGVAGVFAGLFWVMAAIAPQSPSLILALALGLGGLVSLYSRQVGQDGNLNLAGFVLGIIGTGLTLASLWGLIANSSHETLIFDLGMLILGIGLALLGVASLRAKNRWRGLPLGLGSLNIIIGITIWLLIEIPLSHGEKLAAWPGPFLPVFVEIALLGLGWIIQGSMLASDAEAKVAQPPPASA